MLKALDSVEWKAHGNQTTMALTMGSAKRTIYSKI